MIMYTCAKCGREMRCLKNEVAVIHFINNDKNIGIDALRIGDLWRCDTCGCEVVLGFGKQILGMDISEETQTNILKNKYVEIKR